MSGDEAAEPDKLSQEHMGLFSPALAQVVATREQVQEAQRQHAQAQREHERAAGALLYVVAYFRPLYGMKPGDDIDKDGQIIRGK